MASAEPLLGGLGDLLLLIFLPLVEDILVKGGRAKKVDNYGLFIKLPSNPPPPLGFIAERGFVLFIFGDPPPIPNLKIKKIQTC